MTDEIKTDPVVEFMSRLDFRTDLFDKLNEAQGNPEAYDKFFQTPDLYVFMNMVHVLNVADPNRHDPVGLKEHQAMVNLVKWMLVKFATDPTWFCYMGWMFRFFNAHSHPTSYWPIKHSERFYPRNFIVKGQPVNVAEENKQIKTPQEVFKSK